jgi:hypothetical protein
MSKGPRRSQLDVKLQCPSNRNLFSTFAKIKHLVPSLQTFVDTKLIVPLRNLGAEVANVILNKYGAIDYEWGIHSASTDFVCEPVNAQM